MEHTDQEGHQLPKKGQTSSRLSSAFPLFTDTNDIGKLSWRSVSEKTTSTLRTKKGAGALSKLPDLLKKQKSSKQKIESKILTQ